MPAGRNLEVGARAGVRHVGVLRRATPGDGNRDPEEQRATPDEALCDAVGLARQEVRPPRRDYVVSSMTPSSAMVQVCRGVNDPALPISGACLDLLFPYPR